MAGPANTPANLELRILGSLEVRAGGRALRLAGRARKILAVLLLNANRTVPMTQVLDAVWDGQPPATAIRQVQNCVSVLRRLLPVGPAGDRLLFGHGVGYLIRIAETELDASLFTRRIDAARQDAVAGRTEQAAATLREALSLWRGPALAGISGRMIESGATRLNEARLVALENLLDLELAHGRVHEAVVGLAELVAEAPLRVRPVGQLMVALARSGRQAEAMEVYRRVEQQFADHLGLELPSRLRRLRRAVSRGEWIRFTQPPAPRPGRHRLDAGARSGRAGDFDRLDTMLAHAHRESPAATVIIAITGAAGTGKTALASEWADRLADRFPDGQLKVDLGGNDAGSPMHPRDALWRILSALGLATERIPPDLSEMAAVFRSLLMGRRFLLLLDAAVDADQVRPLVPGEPGCLVVITSRDSLAGLVATHGARVLTIDAPRAGQPRPVAR